MLSLLLTVHSATKCLPTHKTPVRLMCGIVAVIGSREAAPLLLEGLRQLEYRGYDSAGIATVNGERQLSCLRAEGKLVNLTQRFEASGAPGSAASATPAGPPMANQKSATRTRTSMGLAGWRWCRTESSRTTAPCGKSCRRKGWCSVLRRIRR
jgi:hypothetical protein